MASTMKRDLNGVFSTPKQATLVGPKGERVSVEVDSSQAKTYFSKGYTLENKPQVDPATVQGQGSGSMLPQGSITTTEDNPMMSSYNSLMMDSLKKAQGVDTTELLKRQRDLQRQAISARTADAPAGYETMSPSQQNQIRNSNAGVIEKELDDNAYQLARAEKAINNFESTFANAQKYGEDFAKSMTVPESMIQNYKTAIETNPESMDKLLSTLNDKSKQAVINALDWNKISTTSDDKEMVKSLMKSYEDAGISPSDSLVVAQKKVLNSRIYQKATKATGSGGGSSSSGGYTAQELRKLRASNIDPSNIGEADAYLYKGADSEAIDEFDKKIAKEIDNLSQGGDWGASWNYIKNLYPEIPDDQLDEALRKEQFHPKEKEGKSLIDKITFWTDKY